MARAKRKSESSIYQLKVTLTESDPPIWRRIQVFGCTFLRDLHLTLQAAMGWDNCHLHLFTIDGMEYTQPDADFDDENTEDETGVRLDKVVRRAKTHFTYVYDFGDCWEHDIVVEGIIPPTPGRRYPACIAGARACPPEDCGGVWGYEEFLEAINDPDHEEHEEMLEWVGGSFDPEAFDLDRINGDLKNFKLLDFELC